VGRSKDFKDIKDPSLLSFHLPLLTYHFPLAGSYSPPNFFSNASVSSTLPGQA